MGDHQLPLLIQVFDPHSWWEKVKGSPLYLEIRVPPISEDWASLRSGYSPLQEDRQHPAHPTSYYTCTHPGRVKYHHSKSL